MKNLCGLKDAGNTWHNHLRDGLIGDLNFKQSLVDPCLFYRDKVLLVIYVDDCIIFSPEKKHADQLIEELKAKFTLEDEGDINSCLGINIARPAKDTIKMNQPALAKRIIESLSLKDQRVHDAPTEPNVTHTKA